MNQKKFFMDITRSTNFTITEAEKYLDFLDLYVYPFDCNSAVWCVFLGADTAADDLINFFLVCDLSVLWS